MNIIIYQINQLKNKNCLKKSFKFHMFKFAYLRKIKQQNTLDINICYYAQCSLG